MALETVFGAGLETIGLLHCYPSSHLDDTQRISGSRRNEPKKYIENWCHVADSGESQNNAFKLIKMRRYVFKKMHMHFTKLINVSGRQVSFSLEHQENMIFF